MTKMTRVSRTVFSTKLTMVQMAHSYQTSHKRAPHKRYLDVTLFVQETLYGICFPLYFLVLFSGMSLYAVILACRCKYFGCIFLVCLPHRLCPVQFNMVKAIQEPVQYNLCYGAIEEPLEVLVVVRVNIHALLAVTYGTNIGACIMIYDYLFLRHIFHCARMIYLVHIVESVIN